MIKNHHKHPKNISRPRGSGPLAVPAHEALAVMQRLEYAQEQRTLFIT